MNTDDGFPISDCCACPVVVEDTDSSIAAVCSWCSTPCYMLLKRDERPFIQGDNVPEHLNREPSLRGVHGLVVAKCQKPWPGALHFEFNAVDDSGRYYYLSIDKEKTTLENATPF